jgi:hypothetical protein
MRSSTLRGDGLENRQVWKLRIIDGFKMAETMMSITAIMAVKQFGAFKGGLIHYLSVSIS